MISRGEVGLIVASVGMLAGLVDSEEFSAIVVMVLITTLITPPILRALFSQKEDKTDKTRQDPASEEAKESEAS